MPPNGDLQPGEIEPSAWITPESAEAGLEAAFVQYERDIRLAVIGKRWKLIQGFRLVSQSDSHGPGDIHALRALYLSPAIYGIAQGDACLRRLGREDLCLSYLADISQTYRKLVAQPAPFESSVEEVLATRLRHAAIASALAQSEVYWLPSDTAIAVMDSVSPSDEMIDSDLRLRSRYATVFFQHGLEFPQDFLDNDDIGRQLVHARDANALAMAHQRPDLLFGSERNSQQPVNVKLAGLIFGADGDERPTDRVLLLVSMSQTFASVEREFGPSRGAMQDIRARNTALEPVLTNLAALISWGDWVKPEFRLDVPDINDPRFAHWSKRPKTVAAQRSGSFSNMHLLDPKPVVDARSDLPAAAEKRASPIEHKRRGHFKRVRIGSRGDWRYRTIYLLATTVMEGNTRDGEAPRQKVFKLPLPKVQQPHTLG